MALDCGESGIQVIPFEDHIDWLSRWVDRDRVLAMDKVDGMMVEA